jgi:hypothetical protein
MYGAKQVAADKDSWARSGWLLVSLGDELWLQEIAPPRRQLGQVSVLIHYTTTDTSYHMHYSVLQVAVHWLSSYQSQHRPQQQ